MDKKLMKKREIAAIKEIIDRRFPDLDAVRNLLSHLMRKRDDMIEDIRIKRLEKSTWQRLSKLPVGSVLYCCQDDSYVYIDREAYWLVRYGERFVIKKIYHRKKQIAMDSVRNGKTRHWTFGCHDFFRYDFQLEKPGSGDYKRTQRLRNFNW